MGGTRDSSIGRTFDRSQFNRTFAEDGGAASIRSQTNRRSDRAVGRAAWAEALGNSQAGLGENRRMGRSGEAVDLGGSNGSGRGNSGRVDSSTLAQHLGGMNDSGGERPGFQRGQNRFARNDLGTGRVTNDQVRRFLSLRDGGTAKEASIDAGNRRREFSGRLGNDAALGGRFVRGENLDNVKRGNGNVGETIGDGNRGDGNRGDGNRGDGNRGDGNRGDGNRGDGNRGRDGKPGDGDRGRNRGDGIGRGGNRPDVIAGNGDGRRGDGRGGNRRDGDGNWNRWRGGELGKGDQRDWSGRWRDGGRFDVAHNIRDHWRDRDWKHDQDRPFHGDWWRHHGLSHHHHHHRWHGGWWNLWGWYGFHQHRPYYWWDWCSAPRLRTWFVYDWATPYYWDYGPGEYIYCYDNVIYVNGQWFQPAPVYYERTVQLAESAAEIPPAQAAQVEWLPLGVFVVSRDGVADNNLLVQLAVTKEGVIGGTVLNQATGATFDIAGNVDKKTQRAAWTYEDENGKKIAMETSVFNLTQPESTALLQNGPEDMKVVELVRLEEPKADANAAQPPAAPAGVSVAKPDAELPPPTTKQP